MRFPRNIKNVFRNIVEPTKPKFIKADGVFVVESPSRVTVIVPLGIAGEDFVTNVRNRHRKILAKMYGKHSVKKLSEVLYRLERE